MDKEEFEKIDKVIRRERLYANVGLMRENVMARFNISRHRLNYLLTRYADGMSFPQYINAIRIEEAYDLITYHPEMSIAHGATPPRVQQRRRYGRESLSS